MGFVLETEYGAGRAVCVDRKRRRPTASGVRPVFLCQAGPLGRPAHSESLGVKIIVSNSGPVVLHLMPRKSVPCRAHSTAFFGKPSPHPHPPSLFSTQSRLRPEDIPRILDRERAWRRAYRGFLIGEMKSLSAVRGWPEGPHLTAASCLKNSLISRWGPISYQVREYDELVASAHDSLNQKIDPGTLFGLGMHVIQNHDCCCFVGLYQRIHPPPFSGIVYPCYRNSPSLPFSYVNAARIRTEKLTSH